MPAYHQATTKAAMTRMLERDKILEISNPYEIQDRLWDALSDSERAFPTYQCIRRCRRYAPLDVQDFIANPQDYHSSFTIAGFGALRLSRITDQRATVCSHTEPGLDALSIHFTLRGSTGIVGNGHDLSAATSEAIVVSGEAGTDFVSSNGNKRLVVWLPMAKLKACLEASLGRPAKQPIVFAPIFGINQGTGASIQRLVSHIVQELSKPSPRSSGDVGVDLTEDLLYRMLLQGLPHSCSDLLTSTPSGHGRRGVRRVEEFIRANPTESLTLADLARVAGCSARSLQTAFREARDMTPMEALQRFRLEAARSDLMGGTDRSVTSVALSYGFSNPGRFAKLYRRAFGETPAQTLRRK